MSKSKGREALLQWCKNCTFKNANLLKEPISSFENGWKDGIAFCLILHHFHPDKIPLDKIDSKDAGSNLKIAFQIGDELGVAPLMDVSEFLSQEKIDTFSLITYLSQLYHVLGRSDKVHNTTEQEQKCRKCKKALTGAVVRFERYMYHQNCFECKQCGKQLSNKYASVGNQPFCELCGKQTWNETIRAKSVARENEGKRLEMQKKAFKVWINSQLEAHLGEKAPKVENLDTDLADGTILIELLSVLYKIPKPNYNKKPQMQVQCLDNASIVLTMLEQVGIKDHFIGPKNIVTGEIKMLLGLCWRVLLDTQIKTLPQNASTPNANFPFALTEDERPRHVLLSWVQSRVAKYNVKVDDFVTSFSNGVAFMALIDSQKQGIVDVKTLDENNKTQNLEKAFALAKAELGTKNLIFGCVIIPGIPKLLEVEDMLSAKPDERSIMAYVSQFVYSESLMNRPKSDSVSNVNVTPKKRSDTGMGTEETMDDENFEVEDIEVFNYEELNSSGYLLKQDPSGILKFWRRRWFNLQGSRLMYYKQSPAEAENPQLEAYISLTFATSIEKNKARENSFMIITPERVYFLQAETSKEYDRWVEVLKKAITYWKKQTTKKTNLKNFPQEKEYKEGYLSELTIWKTWKPQYFVLKDGLLFSYNNKGESQNRRLPLYKCKLEGYTEDLQPEEEVSSFKIISPDARVIVLKAESELEMHSWLNEIMRQQLIIEDFIESIESK